MAGSIRPPYRPAVSACLLAALVWPAAAHAANPRGGPWAAGELARLDAQLAWYFPMPLASTVSISSYTLLDGYLYAIGTDGKVRALRADTGEFLWTVQISGPATQIFPPAAARTQTTDDVAFTLLVEVVFVDRNTGFITRRLKLNEASVAPVTLSADALYAASVGRHISKYDLKTGLLAWRARTQKETSVPPLFVPSRGIVVASDGIEHVIGGTEDRQVLFKTTLDQPATGWFSVRGRVLYVTTRGIGGSLWALDLNTGEPVRPRLSLEAESEGGPVVTSSAVYQAMHGGGLRRVPLNPDGHGWTYPKGRLFLAEWGDRTAVLNVEGLVEILDAASGRPLGALTAETFRTGIGNTLNDAAIVATACGDIRCLRPMGAPRLNLASFQPVVATRPASQPATAPAAHKPAVATEPVPAAAEPEPAAPEPSK
jgi:outer membrane protein assembly factor BamB